MKTSLSSPASFVLSVAWSRRRRRRRKKERETERKRKMVASTTLQLIRSSECLLFDRQTQIDRRRRERQKKREEISICWEFSPCLAFRTDCRCCCCCCSMCLCQMRDTLSVTETMTRFHLEEESLLLPIIFFSFLFSLRCRELIKMRGEEGKEEIFSDKPSSSSRIDRSFFLFFILI